MRANYRINLSPKSPILRANSKGMSKRFPEKFKMVIGFCPMLVLFPHHSNYARGLDRSEIPSSTQVVNRVADALRLAAQSAGRTETCLGIFYRRKQAHLGAPKATTATARKLACLRRAFRNRWFRRPVTIRADASRRVAQDHAIEMCIDEIIPGHVPQCPSSRSFTCSARNGSRRRAFSRR
jgi:hypothetical protein